MGNTQSEEQTNLYEQYLNEQRIIAAQQEQINNLAGMNLQNNFMAQQNMNTIIYMFEVYPQNFSKYIYG